MHIFLSAWCMLCMIAYILHYKSDLGKPSKNKITPSMSSDYNNMKPTISNRKNFGKKSQITWKLNNILLDIQWATQETKGK